MEGTAVAPGTAAHLAAQAQSPSPGTPGEGRGEGSALAPREQPPHRPTAYSLSQGCHRRHLLNPRLRPWERAGWRARSSARPTPPQPVAAPPPRPKPKPKPKAAVLVTPEEAVRLKAAQLAAPTEESKQSA